MKKPCFLLFAILMAALVTSCAPDIKDYNNWYKEASRITCYNIKTELCKNYKCVNCVGSIDTLIYGESCSEKDNGPKAWWSAGEYTFYHDGQIIKQYEYIITTKKSKMNRWRKDAFCQVAIYEKGTLDGLTPNLLNAYNIKTHSKINSSNNSSSFHNHTVASEFIKNHKPIARHVYATEKKRNVSELTESVYDPLTLEGWEFVKLKGSIGDIIYQIALNILLIPRHIFGWFMWVVGAAFLALGILLIVKSNAFEPQKPIVQSDTTTTEGKESSKNGKKEKHESFENILLTISLIFSLSIGIEAGFVHFDNYKVSRFGGAFGVTEFLSGFCAAAFIISLIFLIAYIIVVKARKLHKIKTTNVLVGYILTIIGLILLAQIFGFVSKLLAWTLLIASLPFLIKLGGLALSGAGNSVVGAATAITDVTLKNGTHLHGVGGNFTDEHGEYWTKHTDGTFTKD